MKKYIIFLLLSTLLFGGASTASCIQSSLSWDLRKSDHIYVGYIGEIVTGNTTKYIGNPNNSTIITPLINIKGSKELNKSFSDTHDFNIGYCSFNDFKIGEKYIIFERDGDISFNTNTISFYSEKYGIYIGITIFLVIAILTYILIKLRYYFKSKKD